jgi:hypothetical protein
VHYVRQLFDENRPTAWRDVSLPGVWYLNSQNVLVPLVSREIRERHDKIHRRVIQSSDLLDDPAYTLNSYNWTTVGAWGFDLYHPAGYLDDVDFFNWDHGIGLDDNKEDEGVSHNDAEDEGHDGALFDNADAPGGGMNKEV